MSDSGRRVNPCRPGYGASCALCCGSHNYNMGSEEIQALFNRRYAEGARPPYKHPYSVSSGKLYADAMQCPHVGLSPDDEICCIIYSEPDKRGEVLSFFNGTCRSFFCPAWDVLTDREIAFAARLMRDWYFYSLLINDIEALQELCSSYSNPEDVPEDAVEELKEEILEKFIAEDGK